MDLPNLIEVQNASYAWFLKDGIRELFNEISPIKDFIGRDLELALGEYYLDEAKFDEVTSRLKNVTYEAPLRVKAKLRNLRTNETKGAGNLLGRLASHDAAWNVHH